MVSAPIVTLTLIGSLIGGANAAITVSNDASNFNLTSQLFNVAGFTVADISSVSGDVTLMIPSITIGNPVTQDHAIAEFTSVLTGDEYVISGDENFDVSFSSSQSVFAFDYVDDSVASIFTLEFFNGMTNVGTSSFTTSAPFATQNFIAFLSDTDFDLVTIRESDGSTNSNELFQFYTATTVPEPSSALLLGLGALGLVSRRRKTE